MAHAHAAGEHGHHIIPKKTLLTVFGALVGLTVLTALTAQFDLGVLNVPLALAIAGSKATLVVMFFMALKYDSPVNTLVFVVGTIFVVIFLTFTLFDTAFRGDVGNVGMQTIQDEQRQEELLRVRASAAAAALDSTAVDTTAAGGAAMDTTAAGGAAPDTMATEAAGGE